MSTIKCVMLSELDHNLGPIIITQVYARPQLFFSLQFGPTEELTCKTPEGYLCKDDFTAIKNYLIPKPELFDRLITL